MFELWRHAEVCEHSGPSVDSGGRTLELPASSRSESDRLIGFWLDREEAHTGFRWATLLRASDRFVGAVGFNSLGPCAEYAYHFVPSHWGMGLAREASELALSWALSSGSESVEVFIPDANTRSTRLALRLGFERSGCPREGAGRYVLGLREASR
jgi:RimJ/RimL family protein N-acetyltransferase